MAAGDAVPTVKCPRCGTVVEHAAGFQPICPACGYGSAASPAPAAMPPPPAPAYPPMQAVPGAKPPPTQGLAIVALILNILIWPGLGSLIGGRSEGWAQGFLFLLGLILALTLLFALIGIPLMVGMWIWSIVTGVNLIKAASPTHPSAATA